MKLYIDDLRACPPGWQLARTVTEAIRILATQDVEEVSIDHDISHSIALSYAGHEKDRSKIARPFPCGETFEPVAWFLARTVERKYNGRTGTMHMKITLHTANPIGAKKMQEILADAGLEVTVALSAPVNGLE